MGARVVVGASVTEVVGVSVEALVDGIVGVVVGAREVVGSSVVGRPVNDSVNSGVVDVVGGASVDDAVVDDVGARVVVGTSVTEVVGASVET